MYPWLASQTRKLDIQIRQLFTQHFYLVFETMPWQLSPEPRETKMKPTCDDKWISEILKYQSVNAISFNFKLCNYSTQDKISPKCSPSQAV